MLSIFYESSHDIAINWAAYKMLRSFIIMRPENNVASP